MARKRNSEEISTPRKKRPQSETAKTVLAQVRKVLAQPGVKQKKVAEAAGMGSGRFSKWWEGTGEPQCVHVAAIAKATGLPISYFFGEAEDERPGPIDRTLAPDLQVLVDLIEARRDRVSPSDVVKILFDLVERGEVPRSAAADVPRALR